MIDPATLALWQQEDRVDLYDVREVPEFCHERIPASVLVPLSRFDPAAIAATPGRHLVLHCKSGVRCGIATRILRASGYNGPLFRLEGGILAWKSAGGNVEPGEALPDWLLQN